MRRLQCLDVGEARMKAGQVKKHTAEFCHCLLHHRVPTWSQLLSVLLHRLESLQGTWRLESSPICRESLAGMCCVGLPSSVCCLPRQRAQPPAPGEKFKTISRTAATTTGSDSWLTGWEGESQTRRELLRGAAVDWVLKVTTAIYGGRERGGL